MAIRLRWFGWLILIGLMGGVIGCGGTPRPAAATAVSNPTAPPSDVEPPLPTEAAFAAPQLQADVLAESCVNLAPPLLFGSAEPPFSSFLYAPAAEQRCQFVLNPAAEGTLQVHGWTGSQLLLSLQQIKPDTSQRWIEFTDFFYLVDLDGGVEQMPPLDGLSDLLLAADNLRLFSVLDRLDESETPTFVSELFVQVVGGSRLVLLHTVETPFESPEVRSIQLIALSADDQLYFSLEPLGRGGGWVDVGDHSNLWVFDLALGEARQLFECAPRHPFCIGAIAPDFSTFVYVERQELQLHIVDLANVETLRSLSTEADFIGRPRFSPTGELAFITTDVIEGEVGFYAANSQLNLLAAPYTGEVTRQEVEHLAEIVTWIDAERLLIERKDPTARSRSLIDRSGRSLVLEGVTPEELLQSRLLE